MNRLDVEPTEIGSHTGYAPVKDVLARKRSDIKRNIEECGLVAADFNEFLNFAGVGEILSEFDPCHHGLGVYAVAGQTLHGIIKRANKYLDDHTFDDSSDKELGGPFTPEVFVAILGMQTKAAQILGEVGTNILTAQTKLKTRTSQKTGGTIRLEIVGQEPEKQAAIPV